MPQTQINCPRCRQPVMAYMEQLFDVTNDPGAKQRLLGGVSNRVACPYCGHQGMLTTPIVYHDADKELLLTYFPSELGLPVNEQEKLIGPLIKQAVDRLPMEKRKAYLLSPQGHLTFQGLIERVLAADGITPEMLKTQQERVDLVERLLSASSPDIRAEIIKQNANKLDEAFFALFSRLAQSAMAGGQSEVAQQMAQLQQDLLEQTEYGQKLRASVGEVEAAAKTLQDAGQGLTREKLLDILLSAPNDQRLRALVSMVRPGMDYTFFQSLTERIDKSDGEQKQKLLDLREKLLDYINQMDRQIEERMKQAGKFLESILAAPDVKAAAQQNLNQFDEMVIEVLNEMLREATSKNDAERLAKLQPLVQVIQEASTPPPEVALIEEMLEISDEAGLEKFIQQHEQEINQQVLDTLGSLASQMGEAPAEATDEEKLMSERLQMAYRVALRHSMQKKIQ